MFSEFNGNMNHLRLFVAIVADFREYGFMNGLISCEERRHEQEGRIITENGGSISNISPLYVP
jgi:hypothetical protein